MMREDNSMRIVGIITRTLPPTDNEGKRVAVKSKDGGTAVYPWDHRYDAPEMHEYAASKVAKMENPGKAITMRCVRSDAMGYGFHAQIEEISK
jgi:hypothetical protein